MKTDDGFRVFLRNAVFPPSSSFPFLIFQIECSLVLTAFELDLLNLCRGCFKLCV